MNHKKSVSTFTINPGIGIGSPEETHTYRAYTWTTDPWVTIGVNKNNEP